MNRVARIAAPSILFALLASPAFAEDAIPNLVGEWSGVADAVIIGSGGYRPGDKTLKDPPFVDQRKFDYAIKGQNGRRFWGEIKSGDRTEPFAAAISLDNKYAYGADTDGNFHFTIRPMRSSCATRNRRTCPTPRSWPPAFLSSAPASNSRAR
jgi:hypothetical protein